MSIDRKMMCAGIGLALLGPLAARAQEAEELSRIRREIAELKAAYESRIRALESRLEAMQAGGRPAEAGAVASTGAPAAAGAPARTARVPAPGMPAPVARGPAVGSGLFNPEVSLILSGLYTRTSRDPSTYSITGFPVPPGTEIGPGERGPSLAESELALTANIDPYLRGAMRLAIGADDTVAVEEAFIQTTGLGNGLTVKAGRFFSGIGYLNELHRHTWDFVDAPLAYQAFLGSQYGDDGVQLKWIAPTDTFAEFGFEVARGRGTPGSGPRGNGAGAAAAYLHLGGDVGDSHSWRAGVSLLQASPRGQQAVGTDAEGRETDSTFSGRQRLWIGDFVWKWAPNGNPARVNFKLQGEIVRRQQTGELLAAGSDADAPAGYRASQWGGYLQAVWQFMPRWRVGLRTERLDPGRAWSDGVAIAAPGGDYAPTRNSLMVDFSPSEYSRFRVQLARDNARAGAPDHQLFLQYQTSLGAHGAHRF
ncbi:MAG: hypothetical protein U1E86_15910 [Burkholderiaceae bacterium]